MPGRYIDTTDVKAYIGVHDGDDDFRLAPVHLAVENQIDRWCGRTFDAVVGTATARLFTAREHDRLVVDDFCTDTQSISGTTTYTIEVDRTGTGTWTTLAQTYVALRPRNARRGGRTVPWDEIRLKHSPWFPAGVEQGVRITARWGWPSVPDEVVEAVKLQTMKLWARKDSPDGTIGMDGGGIVVRVTDKLDKDAQALLMGHRRVVVR